MRLSPAELTALVDASETCPHRFLGLHPLGDGGCVVRCLLPGAIAVEVLEVERRRITKVRLRRLVAQATDAAE